MSANEVDTKPAVVHAETDFLLRGQGKLRSLAPPAGPRIAVVSTLRDVGDQLMAWLRWYHLVGFAHMFLYFDDPVKDNAAIREARAVYSADFISFALNGPELQKEWPALKCWPKFSRFTDDRMCRQLLNIAHCIRRCFRAAPESPDSADWLLHLDHDELFLPPPEGLQVHFEHLDAGGCRLCLYQNYEAVPEDHTLTPFEDVSLFKVPNGRIPRTPLGAEGVEFWTSRTQAGNYFLYYDNGKSAVRLLRGRRSEFAPSSVHVLIPDEDMQEIERGRHGWTTFAESELEELQVPWMVSQPDAVVAGARVLHYPATHFERLFRKYDHLRDFPSRRFGGDLVIPPSFHLEARDCYLEHAAAGPDRQREELKHLLERAAMLQSPSEVQAQLQNGSVTRIAAVPQTLRAGRFVPALPLGVGEGRRPVPSKRGMEELLAAPRRDAELLLTRESGGLMGQLEAGLEAVAQRLESVGWAACALGAGPSLIRKALQEAMQVEGQMASGVTVVRNREVVNQGLPEARRGDRVLFMQEAGLSGPDVSTESSSPTPTVGLLENAICDIAMQLDPLLQRNSLQLRLTERCDGMLSSYDPATADGGVAAYGPHIDNADGDGRVDGRVLTVILYLNFNWNRASGGELAIFQPDEDGAPLSDGVRGHWHDVRPDAGTLVFFRADRVLHEVRPSLAKRFAFSMWFCGQPVNAGGA